MFATRMTARWVCLMLFSFAQPDVASANWPYNSSVNVPLCTAPGSQQRPVSVSDGNGGAIVTWEDARAFPGPGSGSVNDIYAQHITDSGVVDASWPADGQAICTATRDQSGPTMIPDGAGGAIITWHDQRSGSYDIYAQRVSASGTVQWTANGVGVCTAVGEQWFPKIVADGAGGAIVTWTDTRGTDWDIYAQRINAAGVPQWTANGVPLCTAAENQGLAMIASDGAGGAIVTWTDHRSLSSDDVYAQRVSAAGSPLWTPDGVAICTVLN